MVSYLTRFLGMSQEAVLRELGSKQTGLSKSEAEVRLKRDGPNIIHVHKVSMWVILWRQLTGNPLILILGAATAISYATGSHVSAYYIFGMILLSIVLGFWNEFAAERTVQDLLKKVSMSAIVVRQGEKIEIPVSQVAIGDIVLLAPGSIVAADLRLIESGDLEINESTLTGESKAIYKSADVLKGKPAGLHQFKNIGFMSTVVTNGWGKGVVVGVGRSTEFGQIAKSASFIKPETEFQKGLRKFGNLIIKVIIILTVAIFAINALLGHSFLDSLLFALAIAVGLTPELLPIIVTISLSHGAGKLAKKHVISKQLISVENLGNMDILCTDKTGTLTEGVIEVTNTYGPDGKAYPELLKYGLACNSALHHHKVIGNAIDVALWTYAHKNNVKLPQNYKKITEEPFDYERQAMFSIVNYDGKLTLFAKGSPEAILTKCTNTPNAQKVNQHYKDLSNQGFRVIALASKPISSKSKYDWPDVCNLKFEGFITLMDIPKKSAKASIQRLERLSVAVKIVTGDSELVTKHICEEVGVPVDRIVMGSEMTNMDDEQLKKAVLEGDIFARVTPTQKLQIIQELQKLGHVVGYLGDGINDIPSLHNADVGISVNTAVDVAKDAAPIVLLRKGLDVIAEGVIEGRRTFNNTIKYILMGTSSNFGNMFSAAGASFFLPFLPMTPTQILLTNGLYDISQLAIPSDNVDEESLLKPRHWNIKFIKYYMLFFGPISSLYDFLTFATMIFIFNADRGLFQTGWFVESLATEILVVFVIRTSKVPFWKSRPGKWLTITCLSIVVVGLLLPYSPLATSLGFVPLPPLYFLCLILLVGTYLLLVGWLKRIFLRRFSL